MDEIWKDIKGYEEYYQVSNLGRIRRLDKYTTNMFGKKSLSKATIIKPFKDKRETMFVTLKKEYSSKIYTLSRLVYGTFNSDFDYDDRKKIIEYKDEDRNNVELSNLYVVARKDTNSGQKEVICLTTNKEFKSVCEASGYYNINKTGIANCCRGTAGSCGKLEGGTKLVWMFLEDYNKSSKEDIQLKIDNANKPIKRTHENIILRKVLCITTSKKFESIVEANEFYNISQGSINKCCSGILKSAGKLEDGTRLVWRYLDK